MMDILRNGLSTSRSIQRKRWAQQIVDESHRLEDLLPLLMQGDRTSQRMMWLLGDICELAPTMIDECMPLLFSLRNEMPFPGMRRSTAKWLLLTNVPANVEKPAVKQLLSWMTDQNASIGCKSYSAKILVNLAKQKRINPGRVAKVLKPECAHPNKSYAGRIQKLLTTVSKL